MHALVIDDEAVVRHFVADIFREDGHANNNPSEAFEVRQSFNPPVSYNYSPVSSFSS
jgi:chemotaxis response regulator CheB